MALNSSGPISLGGSTVGQSINLELGQSATALASINATNFRALAGVPSGQISLSSFYGKSSASYWMAAINSSSLEAGSVAVDPSGNVYTTFGVTSTSNGPSIVKYDAAGTVQWQYKYTNASQYYINGSAWDSANSVLANVMFQQGFIKTDSSGAMVGSQITNLAGSINFGGFNSLEFSQLAVAGGRPTFAGAINRNIGCGCLTSYYVVMQLTSAGATNAIYVNFGSNTDARAYAIGYYPGSSYIYAGGTNTIGGGFFKATLFKHNANGLSRVSNTTYALAQGSGSYQDITYGIAVDASDNVVINIENVQTARAPLVMLAGGSSITWQTSVQIVAAGSSIRGRGVAMDSSGNIYATYYATTGSNPAYFGLAKFNSSGVLQWARSLTGGTNWSLVPSYGNTIVINSSGLIVLTGYLTNVAVGSQKAMFTAQLPVDGSKTGAYTLTGSTTVTYAAWSVTTPTTSGALVSGFASDASYSSTPQTNTITRTATTFSTSTVVL